MKPSGTLAIVLVYIAVRFTLIHINTPRYPTVKMFDVGQGDAILISLPSRARILIDGGPDYEVDRYLSAEDVFGKCRLSLVVLTHPHYDHLKGLNRVLERCVVDQVAHTSSEYDSKESATWKEVLLDKKAFAPMAGDRLHLGEAVVYFIWPQTSNDIFDKNINNSSVSFLLKYKDQEILFLGDLEKEALSKIDFNKIKNLITGNLEYLKVPHHGGASSLTHSFEELHPKNCLISTGQKNKYKHPHKVVLDYFRKIGCKIRRTDLEGTIEVSLN